MGGQQDSNGPTVNEIEVESPTRTVPIMNPTIKTSAPSPGDPMDVTTPTHSTMGPPTRSSPDNDTNGINGQAIGDEHQGSNISVPNAAAAAQQAQPKVVQTAFIHKLYNMLEDQSIRHLIAWSGSAESFVMSPSNDFSKVLSQYFKHTNISSFVRQLNMYGFHKVSDVFHTGSPESPMWEFKHGNGNFKRGDLVGLREIKRRASRHALVHRDSYPSSKPPTYSQPGTPAEPVLSVQDSTDSRLTSLEHNLYEVHSRLSKSEESVHYLNAKNQTMMEALSRSLSLNHEMSRALLGVVSPEAPVHRNIIDMQTEMQRQIEVLRSLEEPNEPPFSGSRPYFSNLSLDGAPVSPRQLAQDDPRRPPVIGAPPRQHQHTFRPAVPSNLSITPRRYGSIGSNPGSSPSSARYHAPPPPPPPHPLSAITTPPMNLARRHTSADIRQNTWQPTPSSYTPGNASSQWPSSPKRGPTAISEDQRIRDSFSTYSLQAASHSHNSRPGTPPFTNGNGGGVESLSNWSWGSGRGDKFGGSSFGSSGLLKDSSGPPTRRGSMAHILNPAETAERDEEHDEEQEDRKRKRMQ